jgi:hypothetical protein
MRRTPPVVVHTQPQRAVQAVVALIVSLAGVAQAHWAISHFPATWPLLLALPLLTVAAWRAAAVRPRRLRWDGEAWWLAEAGSAAEAPVQLRVVMDLHHWLLLRARPGPVYLPLSRRQHPAHWGALRATLFSAAGGASHR